MPDTLGSLRPPRLPTSGKPASPALGEVYFDTTTNILYWWNGTTWVAAGSAGYNPPTYVTSLPGSPSDGQEVFYAADATNGVIWHLRYRASASGSYKWEFVGGAPLSSQVVTSESRGTGYADLATVGPVIVLPLAGDFMITHGNRAYLGGSAANTFMSYQIGGTAAVDSDAVVQAHSVANYAQTAMRTQRKNGLSAVTLTAKYKTDAQTGTWLDRWMEVIPVRVG